MAMHVDIATGETTLHRADLQLDGVLPLVLSRTYRSGAPVGIFGLGWRHSLERTIQVQTDRVVYRDGDGRETVFAPVAPGMEAKHPEGLTLQHHAEDYVVYASPLWQEVFSKRGASGPMLPLSKIEDGNGNRIDLMYAGGRLSEVSDVSARRIRFGYTGATVTQIVLAATGVTQPIRSFRYGAGGTLVAETDAAGATTEYGYQDGVLIRVAEPSGSVWQAQYGAERRCTALWSSDGSVVQHVAYDPLRQSTRTIGMNGEQTVYRHVLGSQVIEMLDAEGESQHFYYDEARRLMGFTLPDGTVESFRRIGAEEGVLFHMEGENRIAEAKLGASGLVETVSDAVGNTFELGYDERFNLATLTTPLGSTWSFERDRQGRVVGMERPTGQRVRLQHEGATVRVIHDERTVRTSTTDAFGRVAKRSDALAQETNLKYDPEGRVTSVTVGTYQLTLAYDRAGHLIRLADTDRRDTRWQRDAIGRVMTVEKAGERALRLRYDMTGRLAEASVNGALVRFAYDAQDRLRTAEATQGRSSFAYGNGTVAVTTGEGTEVYDVFGNVVERTGRDGRRVSFQYSPRGQLLASEWGEGTSMIEYDADGRLDRFERGGQTLVFAHDAVGTLVALEDSRGRHAIIEYDGLGHPVMIRMAESTFRVECDVCGNLTAVHAPDGATCTVAYDELQRPVSVTYGTEHRPLRDEETAIIRLFEARGAGDDHGALGVVASRAGLTLSVWFGALAVPLWGRSERRCLPFDRTHQTVQSLVHGAEHGVGAPPSDEDLVAWVRRCTRRIGIGVPTPDQLGLAWAPLDLFVLNPTFYAPHILSRQPRGLKPMIGRAAGLTGSHRARVPYHHVWSRRDGATSTPLPAPLGGPLTPLQAAALVRTLTTLVPA